MSFIANNSDSPEPEFQLNGEKDKDKDQKSAKPGGRKIFPQLPELSSNPIVDATEEDNDPLDFEPPPQTPGLSAMKKAESEESWDFGSSTESTQPPKNEVKQAQAAENRGELELNPLNDNALSSETAAAPSDESWDFSAKAATDAPKEASKASNPADNAEAEKAFFGMFTPPDREAEQASTEPRRTVPRPKASRHPPCYVWGVDGREPPSTDLAKAGPKELLDMSAMGAKISGRQFLGAANRFKDAAGKDPAALTLLHQLYDKAGEKFMAEGNIAETFNAWSLAAQHVQWPDSHGLYSISDKLNANGLSIHVSFLDTGLVKGGNVRIDRRNDKGVLKDVFEFRLSQPARSEIQARLAAIEENLGVFQESLPPGIQGKVTISRAPYEFIGIECNYTPPGAEAIRIHFEGVGAVLIGDTKYGCLNQNVRVQVKAGLPDGEALRRVHQMLAVIGCGPVLGLQSQEYDERLKIAQLFRAYYPSGANGMERTKEFYEVPLDALKMAIINKVPEMRDIFEKYENNPSLTEKVEIYPGKSIWAIKDLSAQMRKKGALGLMCGLGNNAPDLAAGVKAVSSILLGGSLSAMDRLQAGRISFGASCQDDLECGGGDHVFTRLITAAMANTPVKDKTKPKEYAGTKFPFSGYVQVLFDLDVVNRGGYGYPQDNYGVKNPENSKFDKYKDRPTLITLAETKNEDNEVFVKNRIGPEFIRGLMVQSKEAHDALVNRLIEDKFIIQKTPNKTYVMVEGRQIPLHIADKFSPDMWDR